ncbi:hypothetical protein BDN67DRAFT_74548 [Paxillus ammoniavirescens]|nr:hypothetical protein BDN67DRAFT_74548 [Paxillus ammoniavirescens]
MPAAHTPRPSPELIRQHDRDGMRGDLRNRPLAVTFDSHLRPVLRIESILGTVEDSELVCVERIDIPSGKLDQDSTSITKCNDHRGPCKVVSTCIPHLATRFGVCRSASLQLGSPVHTTNVSKASSRYESHHCRELGVLLTASCDPQTLYREHSVSSESFCKNVPKL